jgi:hypothetical protein
MGNTAYGNGTSGGQSNIDVCTPCTFVNKHAP